MIRISYNPTINDFIEFNLYHHWYSPDKRKFRNTLILKVALWVMSPIIFYCFFILNPVTDDIRFPLLVGFSIAAISSSVYYLTYKVNLRSNCVRFYSNPLNSAFLEETYVEIENNVLKINQKSYLMEIPISSFVKITENNGSYYLYTNSMQALIIPRRAFENSELNISFRKALNL